jgi:hypothetical protein
MVLFIYAKIIDLGLIGPYWAANVPGRGVFRVPIRAPWGKFILGVAVLWVLKLVLSVHVFLRRFRCSSGPMDPCEVHV